MKTKEKSQTSLQTYFPSYPCYLQDRPNITARTFLSNESLNMQVIHITSMHFLILKDENWSPYKDLQGPFWTVPWCHWPASLTSHISTHLAGVPCTCQTLAHSPQRSSHHSSLCLQFYCQPLHVHMSHSCSTSCLFSNVSSVKSSLTTFLQ